MWVYIWEWVLMWEMDFFDFHTFFRCSPFDERGTRKMRASFLIYSHEFICHVFVRFVAWCLFRYFSLKMYKTASALLHSSQKCAKSDGKGMIIVYFLFEKFIWTLNHLHNVSCAQLKAKTKKILESFYDRWASLIDTVGSYTSHTYVNKERKIQFNFIDIIKR